MPINTRGGNRAKKGNRRVRKTTRKFEGGTIFAKVIKKLGMNQLQVVTEYDEECTVIIPGCFKRKVWINVDTLVRITEDKTEIIEVIVPGSENYILASNILDDDHNDTSHQLTSYISESTESIYIELNEKLMDYFKRLGVEKDGIVFIKDLVSSEHDLFENIKNGIEKFGMVHRDILRKRISIIKENYEREYSTELLQSILAIGNKVEGDIDLDDI